MSDRLSSYKKKAGFYMTRLRRASAAELVYRLRQGVTAYRAGRLVRRGQMPCRVPVVDLQAIRLLRLPVFQGQVERADVDRIMAGFRFNLDADPDKVSAFEREMRGRFCPSTRLIEGGVDIRAVWEAARLQHITILIAWLRQHPDSPDCPEVKEYARQEILRWLADNPFLYGPHYLSVMECGLRLPVLFYALKTLDTLNDRDAGTILTSVYLHAWWIEKNLSLYSSLGNHTVCEALGLVFAGSMFRATPAGQRWLTIGQALLGLELPHQVLADGGPAEQALGYHRFVLDIYWLAVDFLECNNLRICDDFKARLMSGEGFLSSFSDPGAGYPAIGDSDDGHALAPGLSPQRFTSSKQQHPLRTFSISGYTVFRGDSDSLLTFDHGPLGMAPLYNHGHADALSVTLSIAGVPFLVDSGTFRYNGVPALRRYFKGTRAHNTVLVDGLDQATQLTGFVWGDPFSGRLERTEETVSGLLVEASHDGYSRLDNPLQHCRSVLASPEGGWLIRDRFQGSGRHTFELNFHFHPEVVLTKQEHGWLAESHGRAIRLELAGEDFNLVHGQTEPVMGWFSPAYNRRVPAPVLQAFCSGEAGDVCFETRISLL
jgi:hypothetical protein